MELIAKETPNHRRSVNLNPAILGDKRMVSSQAGWFIRPDPTTVSEAWSENKPTLDYLQFWSCVIVSHGVLKAVDQLQKAEHFV